MRRLVLVRHAKSSWKDLALADHERPLNRRGQRDALLIGTHLAHAGLRVDEVLCSTAVRTRATWRRIASRWPAAPEPRFVAELYLPTVRGLEAVLATADAASQTVLVVGHSPSLDAFVLTHAAPSQLQRRLAEGLPTGSVAVLELGVQSFAAIGEARGKVSRFVTPRELGSTRDGHRATPTKAERFEITRHDTVQELASLAVGSALAQLRGNASGAHAAHDPGFAHQLRVAARRLRVYLRCFEKRIGQAHSARLRGELRWLFRVVGALRDDDVFAVSELGKHIARSRTTPLVALARALEERRAGHQKALQKALGGMRYAALVRDLLALEAELTHATGGHERAARWLKKRLNHRLARVQAIAHRAKPGDATTVHALRKELKKLRYVAELGRGAFRRRHVHDFVDRLEALQDALGRWNDAVAGEALLEHALAKLPVRVRQAARREVAALNASSRAALDELEPCLHEARELEPFWR